MTGDDVILNSSVLYTEAEVLAEFQESCKAAAEELDLAFRQIFAHFRVFSAHSGLFGPSVSVSLTSLGC